MQKFIESIGDAPIGVEALPEASSFVTITEALEFFAQNTPNLRRSDELVEAISLEIATFVINGQQLETVAETFQLSDSTEFIYGKTVALLDAFALSVATSAAPAFSGRVTETVRLEVGSEAVRGLGAIVSENVGLAPLITVIAGVVIRERLRLAVTARANGFERVALLESFLLDDAVSLGIPVAVVETLALEVLQVVQAAATVLESLQITPVLTGVARFGLSVSERLRLADSLARFFGAEIVEGVQLAQDVRSQLRALQLLTESLQVGASIAPRMIFRAVVSDGVEFDTEQLLRTIFSPVVVEGVDLSAAYVAPDGGFTTWAMNARTGAVTEYQNFVFNSFARVGRRYVGASSEGLYELLGDTDNGADIPARIRSGYMQFGSTRLSRLDAAYIAATGEGTMVLKIITKDGDEYVYQADTRNGRSTKVHMGKGQRARYFAFELVTTAHDFDLDTLEFVPVVVGRRV